MVEAALYFIAWLFIAIPAWVSMIGIYGIAGILIKLRDAHKNGGRYDDFSRN